MSTVNVERVGSGLSPEKKLGSTTFSSRNGILCRYFYFAMSLLMAAIVVAGFKRTVDANLFHPAVPRPFILWIHGAAFAGWVIFFICQSSAGPYRQSQLASLDRMVWRWSRYRDGSARRHDRDYYGPL